MPRAATTPRLSARPARLLGLLGVLLLATSASAEMMQRPLQAEVGGVPPNLVFTLDDSGSMWWECLPDSLCTSSSLGLEAIPKRSAVSTSNRRGTIVYDDVDVLRSSTSSTKDWTKKNVLLSRQMRSSAKNPLYYNPNIQYKPWLKADGTRWPASPPSAAPVMPGVSTTQDLRGIQTIAADKWCWGLTTCGNSGSQVQKAHIARYYNMSGNGNSANNYELVKIESGYTYPRVGGQAIDKSEGRTDCASTRCTYEEEIQNFANWYTYYRTRALTAIAGTAEAFAAVPEEYRVGYGRINKTSQTNIDGVSTKTLERGVRGFSSENRNQFYTWLFARTKPSGGTPLRRAMDDVGQYFSRADNRGPWGADPGKNDSTPHSSCRRSIHLLMTDGMWNGDQASTSDARKNVDNSIGNLITSPTGEQYQYQPAAPYQDSYSNTLADVAMYYWNRDLRPTLANNVKPIASNPAFWQHMVNFTIAFGVDGTLNNPGDLAALKAGTKSWPNPQSGDRPEAMDDLWHAAINSRGRALSARNSEEYADAITSILDEIKAMEGSQAGVSTSTTTLPPVDSASSKYTPSFSAPDWSGDIKAQSIDATGTASPEARWTAAEALPEPEARQIYTWDPGATTSSKVVEFKWDTLSATLREQLTGSTTSGAGLVSYLRGNRTGEGSMYRARTSPLGDIVNSTPQLVHDLVNLYYNYLPLKSESSDPEFGAESYRKFVQAKSLRNAQLVAGANDGMLHFFSDVDGAETFAYVPNAIIGSMAQLANTDYSHRYYVDGPVYETDVYDKSNQRWVNLVQGSGGAGGKYLYTVRVPVPYWSPESESPPAALNAATSAPGAGDVLWEISSDTSGFADLGHVLSQPDTGVTLDGTWVTIFGNGYESTSNRAQLFIVNALTGALIDKIDTGVGDADAPNGLGGVAVLRDSRQRIVGVYAGDLHGNLWKFDLASENKGDWKVAFDGQPLFTAVHQTGDGEDDVATEPITAAPVLRNHPVRGTMVLFGSGRLFAEGDQFDTGLRTLYGIWDDVAVGAAESATTQGLAQLSSLVEQSIIATPVGAGNGLVFRSFDLSPVDYSTKRGWYMPLTLTAGERVIDTPQLVSTMVYMQTVSPSSSEDDCTAGALDRRGYMLDPFMSGKVPQAFASVAGGTLDSSIVDLGDSGKTWILVRPDLQGGVTVNESDQPLTEADFGGIPIPHYWRHIITAP